VSTVREQWRQARRTASVPRLYHGTDAALPPGAVLVPGGPRNYDPSLHVHDGVVFLSDDLAQAFFFSVLGPFQSRASMEPEHVYEVEADATRWSAGGEWVAPQATIVREVTSEAKAAFTAEWEDVWKGLVEGGPKVLAWEFNRRISARRTAASIRVSPSSPLPHRYLVNERIGLYEGSGYAPGVEGAEQRMQEGYKVWRADNPGVRRPERFVSPERWVPTGYIYFQPINAEPGLVAFLDSEVGNGGVRLAYLAVRPDHRGRGHARSLIQAAYDRHPGKIIDWGRMMQPQIGRLYDWFSEHHPEQTGNGRRDY
jgi:GNAT superfamily N-acetyltransferase